MLTPLQRVLRRTILDVSYKRSFSHIGSCLTAVDAIAAIYNVKKRNDIFVLSNGHAAVAWYAVLYNQKRISQKTLHQLSVHPDRNLKNGIPVSTGSLGHGLPIAVGMAMARKSHVYCMVSDGEMTEGSVWESLRLIREKKIANITIIVNANGWSALGPINRDHLIKQVKGFGFKTKVVNGHTIALLEKVFSNPHQSVIFCKTTVDQYPFLKGVEAHYYLLGKDDYINALKKL